MPSIARCKSLRGFAALTSRVCMWRFSKITTGRMRIEKFCSSSIQVDSIAKPRENDEVIPANVAEAANFYQANGLLHGRPQIRAEDQERTRILGNFRYDYNANSLRCEGYPWYDRVFTKYHTEIECDPAVWNRVEGLIRAKLPPVLDKNALSGNAE